jgi:glutaryl-CoA dehydrogenase
MATSTRPSFDWQDPFLLRDQLTDEERMVTDSARQFFQKELMPNIIDANRNEHFDRNIMRQMGEMGLLGVTIEGYGCAGLSSVAYGLIAKEVEAVDSG